MVNPRTVNTGIIVPLTGSDVDLWGENDINPNMVAIDGYFGGVQTVAVTNVPVALTSPTLFTPTPTPGPTQAQNAVLRFTGVLTANVQVTLPLPGPIVIENKTTGNFVLSFRALGVGEIVAVDQGEVQHIYNDGTNVRFVDLGGRIGEVNIWAGLIAMPAWVTTCTKQPYLLCNGTVYNFSDFPYLGARLGGAFGGNGITTFAVPDLRGRVPLPYDGTGARITTAGSGLNGTVIGATLDQQTVQISQAQLPNVNFANSGIAVNATMTMSYGYYGIVSTTPIQVGLGTYNTGGTLTESNVVHSGIAGITITTSVTAQGSAASGGSGAAVPNVQPSQVTGIAAIRAG